MLISAIVASANSTSDFLFAPWLYISLSRAPKEFVFARGKEDVCYGTFAKILHSFLHLQSQGYNVFAVSEYSNKIIN